MMSTDGPFCSKDLEPSTAIYRIHPHKRLDTLLSGKLILRSTTTWLEPYENLLSRCGYGYISDGKIKQAFFDRDRFPVFGQCWSTVAESDALWRIYSALEPSTGFRLSFCPEEGVRLRTAVKKLLDCLATGVGKKNAKNCYIGRVTYLDQTEMLQQIANVVRRDRDQAVSGVSGHVDGLLLKRNPFSHESEIRLLYVDSDRKFEGQPQIEIPVDVTSVIEEITLDPRVRGGDEEAKRIEWIRGKGFSNEVKRSLLYLGVLLSVPLYSREDLEQLENKPGLR